MTQVASRAPDGSISTGSEETSVTRIPPASRSVGLCWPFHRPAVVLQGGLDTIANHHANDLGVRHAIDLAPVTDTGRVRSGGSAPQDVTSYVGFGEPVLAPADGRVSRVRDGHPDHSDAPFADPYGNHVVLELEGGDYLTLGHLQQDSIVVEPGDSVRIGEVLGAVGNSGVSTMPHLHVHVQAGPRPTSPSVGIEFIETDACCQPDDREAARGTVIWPVGSGT